MIKFYTYSEKLLDLERMSIDDIRIDDIAHALANINRFNGMIRYPVSVAQHSIYVSRLCERPNALQGLLHDASEAYLGDITYFLKRSVGFNYYRELELVIQDLIYEKFGCDLDLTLDVRKADSLMTQYEAEKGYKHFSLAEGLTKASKEKVGVWKPWNWKTSKAKFFFEFYQLWSKK